MVRIEQIYADKSRLIFG